MELGAENRKKLIAAVVLGVLAIVLMVMYLPSLFGTSGSPAQTAAAPAAVSTPDATGTRPKGTRTHVTTRKVATPPVRSLDPTLRFDWLKSSEAMEYKGAGRNIFRAQVDIPKPVVPVVRVAPPVPTGPPPPPPINLKFFGFASKPGEPKKIFLSEGEDVFVAMEGDIVDRRYKVLRITPSSVEIEDVLNNNRQVIPLTQG